MRLFSCGESNLYHGQQAGTMTKLPASVIRDVVRFVDEVGVAFHIDTSYLIGVRECVPCAYIIAYWYQYIVLCALSILVPIVVCDIL